MRDFIDFCFSKISILIEESRTYRLQKRSCESCSRLMLLIEKEKREKAHLMDLLSFKDNSTEPRNKEEDEEKKDLEPVIMPARNWVQKRIELEAEARRKADEYRSEMVQS